MNYEVVNLTAENGTKVNKEVVHELKCASKDTCELYKQGKCFHLNTFQNCVYGDICSTEGYTTKAESYGELIAIAKASSEYNALTNTERNVIAKIGEYTLVDIEYLNHVVGLRDLVVRRYFIKGDLTMEVAKQILDGKAVSYSGAIIEAFEEEKKCFLRQLKTYDKEMYDKLILEYPQYMFDLDYYHFKRPFPLSDLNTGYVVIGRTEWWWNGVDELRCHFNDLSFTVDGSMLNHEVVVKVEDATKQKAFATNVEQFKK